MKSRFPDDWGTALGSDFDVVTNTKSQSKKPAKKDSLGNLVYEFRDQMMMDTSGLMNAQTNGPALMKAFRKALDVGHSYDDIRLMIKQFYKDIQVKPLTDGIPAWKAFVGRMDSLAVKVKGHEVDYSYDGPKIDPRLLEGGND